MIYYEFRNKTLIMLNIYNKYINLSFNSCLIKFKKMRKFKIQLLALLLLPSLMWSQDFDDLSKAIPADEDVRIGTLKNGLTYYIRNNEKPEDKVDLRLVVKAGSILETDEQQGLAHFMEHMAFNGTKRFPKNTLVDYLQSIGVQFGQHLNAYTSFDETVYFLPIPVDEPEKVEKGFQILEDWAFNVVLTPEEIDKERGVVLEEYRIGLGAGKRMLAEYLPKEMYNSRYAERLPIGKKEILENFSYDKLTSFYEDWYRPNLMSVIVVGDIDVDEMEKKVKNHFAKYKNPKNEKPRESFDLPSHEETLVSVVTDPEATNTDFKVMYKEAERDTPSETIGDLRENLLKSLFSSMLNNRLREKANESDPPYTYAYSYHGGTYAKDYEAFQSFAMTAEDKQLEALQVVMEENARARKFGFNASELERAKEQLLSRIESNYNERDKKKSAQYVSTYQNNFLEESPILSEEFLYNMYNHFMPNVKLEEVNQIAIDLIKEQNVVVTLKGPEKEGLIPPTEAEVLAVLDIDESTLEPYQDTELAESMVRNPLPKGGITNKETNEELGTTTYTLSNGAKLTVKPTEFKNDEIMFEAISYGGTNLLSNEEYAEVQWAMGGLNEAGVAGMDQNELNKFMSGKQANLRMGIGSTTESMTGSTRPKDFELLMQMVFAHFTDLNYDEEAFEIYKAKQNSFLANMAAMPQIYYQKEFYGFLMEDNPRFNGILPSAEDLENASYKKAYEFYEQQFANAGDFHFFLVGNLDLNEVEDLAKTYLASLPAKEEADKMLDLGYRMKKGDIKKVVKKGTDPKSTVNIMMYGDLEYDAEEHLAMKALGEILTIKLIEELRENESGVYGASARGSMSKMPYGSYNFSIQFPCGPENAEQLTESALRELDKIIANGPTAEDLDKFKEAQKVDFKEKSKENRFWMGQLTDAYTDQKSADKTLEYLDRVDALDVSDIQKVAKKYLTDNRVIGMHMPEDKS